MNSLKIIVAASTLSLAIPSLEGATLPNVPEKSSETSPPISSSPQLDKDNVKIPRTDLTRVLSYYTITERFCQNELAGDDYKDHPLLKSLQEVKEIYQQLQIEHDNTKGYEMLVNKVMFNALQRLAEQADVVKKEFISVNYFLKNVNANQNNSQDPSVPECIRHELKLCIQDSKAIPKKWSKRESWEEDKKSIQSRLKLANELLSTFSSANKALKDHSNLKFDPEEGQVLPNKHMERIKQMVEECHILIAAITHAPSVTAPEITGLQDTTKEAPYLLVSEVDKLTNDPVYQETSFRSGREENGYKTISSVLKYGGFAAIGLGLLYTFLSVWSRKADADLRAGVKKHGRDLTEDERRRIGSKF